MRPPKLRKIRITAELPVGDADEFVLLELTYKDSGVPVLIGPVKRRVLVTFETDMNATTRLLEDLNA